jgi:hypothetical protein
MGNWRTNSACATTRINREITTVSMTPEQEALLADDESLHSMNPESYFIWVEEQQEQYVINMDTIWD